MAVTATSTALESIVEALKADPGLAAGTTLADFNAGLAAARVLNEVMGEAIEHFGFNADKVITPEELMAISDYVRATPLLHYYFMMGHGNDEGNVETGFHKLQNDGGNLTFQGRNMVDTVIDAIYHYGEEYFDGRFVNEDGNQNEEVADVAGWINYFLNGRNIVFGTNTDDMMGSGDYSLAVAAASNEIFQAGAGNDKIWAHTGHDKIYCGTGDDEAGGGTGNDTIWGDAGIDVIYGEQGDDTLYGGDDADQIGGGEGNDVIWGDAGNDDLWGSEGNDKIAGGFGADKIGGGEGHDSISGGAGNDDIWGDTGNDTIDGDSGNDTIGGGDGNNTLRGGTGDDDIHGGEDRDLIDGGADDDTAYGGGGVDRILGGDGNDDLAGGDGNDRILGGAGNDIISGGEGADALRGCAGADTYYLWDNDDATDTIFFAAGDAGRTLTTIDIIEGFTSGEDKIDLKAFGPMTLEDLDYVGGGKASCYYDGRYLRIDTDGDRASDMIVQLKWVDSLTAADLVFA